MDARTLEDLVGLALMLATIVGVIAYRWVRERPRFPRAPRLRLLW